MVCLACKQAEVASNIAPLLLVLDVYHSLVDQPNVRPRWQIETASNRSILPSPFV